MTPTTLSPGLDHFIDIARRGKHRGSSGGEKAARILALAFLDEGLGLDDLAIDGFVEFMQRAKSMPDTARHAIG